MCSDGARSEPVDAALLGPVDMPAALIRPMRVNAWGKVGHELAGGGIGLLGQQTDIMGAAGSTPRPPTCPS